MSNPQWFEFRIEGSGTPDDDEDGMLVRADKVYFRQGTGIGHTFAHISDPCQVYELRDRYHSITGRIREASRQDNPVVVLEYYKD